jgi:hypothetical protein
VSCVGHVNIYIHLRVSHTLLSITVIVIIICNALSAFGKKGEDHIYPGEGIEGE